MMKLYGVSVYFSELIGGIILVEKSNQFTWKVRCKGYSLELPTDDLADFLNDNKFIYLGEM